MDLVYSAWRVTRSKNDYNNITMLQLWLAQHYHQYFITLETWQPVARIILSLDEDKIHSYVEGQVLIKSNIWLKTSLITSFWSRLKFFIFSYCRRLAPDENCVPATTSAAAGKCKMKEVELIYWWRRSNKFDE